MDKKNIILDLPCELIDKIDRLNSIGDRSDFISFLIEEQLKQSISSGINVSTEFITKMNNSDGISEFSGELDLIDNNGISIGKYNINSLDGFEKLIKKIHELSEDPAVQIRARSLF